MLLHQLELVARERRRLEQQGVGDADLADVVQVAAAIERREILGGPAERGSERDGIVRQPLAVAVGVLVARFDDERQAPEDALGGIEVVGVLLEADERRDPGLQLLGVEGLADEVVGARLQAADLVLAGVQPGDERDRNEPRLGRLFELRADLEAVGAGHLDVEQHQVDVQVAKRGDRLGPGGHRHDLIAITLQQPLEQCAVDLFIVARRARFRESRALDTNGVYPKGRPSTADSGRERRAGLIALVGIL